MSFVLIGDQAINGSHLISLRGHGSKILFLAVVFGVTFSLGTNVGLPHMVCRVGCFDDLSLSSGDDGTYNQKS